MSRQTRIGVAALACGALFASGASAVAAPSPPKQVCQGLISLKAQSTERYGLELFVWELCGKKKGQGIPFG